MAEIVLGVGSSHSPMVSLGGADWLEWGRRDLGHPMLYTEDGRHIDYAQALVLRGDGGAAQATLDACEDGAGRVGTAVERLRTALADAEPDVVVIVGDDQDEHLLADNLPPFCIYWGDTIVNEAVGELGDRPAIVGRYLPGYREPEGAVTYPVAADLARHVIDVALDEGFDVAASERLPAPERGMGHAFGFPMRRLIPSGVPIVPIMVNTYNPPSQPRARRCRHFGAMLRHAIAAFDGVDRVAVIASGGLSHFIVLEELDRRVLDALTRGDLDTLCAVPEHTYVAGTSEIKNWLTVGATCDGMRFEIVDYVPGYRTPAGTGTGLAFGLWHPA